jgi:RNA recognition motif-containing protein
VEHYIKMNDQCSVYIRNIPYHSTELELGKKFEQFGEIIQVKIQEDEVGRSAGFGYIEFEDKGIFLFFIQ